MKNKITYDREETSNQYKALEDLNFIMFRLNIISWSTSNSISTDALIAQLGFAIGCPMSYNYKFQEIIRKQKTFMDLKTFIYLFVRCNIVSYNIWDPPLDDLLTEMYNSIK